MKYRDFSLSSMAWILAAGSLLLAAYWPALSGSFIFDDYPNIVSRDAMHLQHPSAQGLWAAAFGYNPDGGLPRPVSNITFALNYMLGGLDPTGYKWGNLGLHAINSVLLWIFLNQVILIQRLSASLAAKASAALSLAWALHPLQVSTVMYVVQRMEILCLTFMLGALICYLRARLLQIATPRSGWGWLAAATLLAALAVGSKETGFLVAVYGLAIECILLRWNAKSSSWRRIWLAMSVAGGGAIIVGYAWIAILVSNDPFAYSMRDFGAWERLLAQLELVPVYLGQILLPSLDNMVFFYDHLVPPTAPTAKVIAGAAILLSLVVTMVIVRNRWPLSSLGIAIFLASHLITSSALPLEIAFEHRNYFATSGALLALTGPLIKPGALMESRVTWIIVFALIALLAFLTGVRSSYWGNPQRLAAYLVEINPASTRASMDLGEQYMLAARKDPSSQYYKKAVAEFERAATLPQGSLMGEHGLLMMAASFGASSEDRWWDSMRAKLSIPPIRPQEVDALVGMVEHRNRGLALDDTQLAATTLQLARRQPLSPEILFLFAKQALLASDGGTAAVELFGRGILEARSSDPDYEPRVRAGIIEIAGPRFLERIDQLMLQLGDPDPVADDR